MIYDFYTCHQLILRHRHCTSKLCIDRLIHHDHSRSHTDLLFNNGILTSTVPSVRPWTLLSVAHCDSPDRDENSRDDKRGFTQVTLDVQRIFLDQTSFLSKVSFTYYFTLKVLGSLNLNREKIQLYVLKFIC